MAVTGGINIQGNIQGITSGGPVQIGPVTIVASLTEPSSQNYTLSTAVTTIAVPATATGCYIEAPSTNTIQINLTTAAAALVLALSAAGPNAFSLAAGQTANIYLTCASATVPNVMVKFI